MPGKRFGVERLVRRGHELRMRRNDRSARDRGKPLAWHKVDGRLTEGQRAASVDKDRIGGELAVALPLQPERPERGAVVTCAPSGWRGVELLAQGRKVSSFALVRLQRLVGTGVDLVRKDDSSPTLVQLSLSARAQEATTNP